MSMSKKQNRMRIRATVHCTRQSKHPTMLHRHHATTMPPSTTSHHTMMEIGQDPRDETSNNNVEGDMKLHGTGGGGGGGGPPVGMMMTANNGGPPPPVGLMGGGRGGMSRPIPRLGGGMSSWPPKQTHVWAAPQQQWSNPDATSFQGNNNDIPHNTTPSDTHVHDHPYQSTFQIETTSNPPHTFNDDTQQQQIERDNDMPAQNYSFPELETPHTSTQTIPSSSSTTTDVIQHTLSTESSLPPELAYDQFNHIDQSQADPIPLPLPPPTLLAHQPIPLPSECGGARLGAAICLGFRGLLITCQASNVVMQSNSPIPCHSFEPLSLARDDEVVAQDLERRGRESDTDSSTLLWDALAMLVRCHGKRHRSDPDAFERRMIDLLSAHPFEEEPPTHTTWLPESTPIPANTTDPLLALAEFEMLLLNGDQEGAVLHAVRHHLWSHALIVAHFISAASYRRVVGEFLAFSSSSSSSSRQLGAPSQVILNLLTGRRSEAINSALVTTGSWRQTLRSILVNRTPGDATALTSLGDRVWHETHSVEAAHLCYLLAGHGPLEDGNESRIVLVGSDHVSSDCTPTQFVDEESIIRTEAVIHAMSRAGTLNEDVMASFQPFRLVYAMWLADRGEMLLCNRWMESIAATLSSSSHHNHHRVNEAFYSQFESFQARLRGEVPFRSTTKDFTTTHIVAGNKLDFGLANEPEMAHQAPRSPKNESPSTTRELPLGDAVIPQPPQPQTSQDTFSDPFAAANSTPLASADPFAAASRPFHGTTSRAPNFGRHAISEPTAKLEPPTLKPPSPRAAPVAAAVPPKQLPNSDTAPPPPPTVVPNRANSSSAGSSYSMSGKLQDAKGWLVQHLVGIPPNAKVANTGNKLTGYYDEKLKRWVFPDDDPNAPLPGGAGPPPVKLVKTKPDGDGGMPIPNAGGPPPSVSQHPLVPAPKPGSMRNRYVVQT